IGNHIRVDGMSQRQSALNLAIERLERGVAEEILHRLAHVEGGRRVGRVGVGLEAVDLAAGGALGRQFIGAFDAVGSPVEAGHLVSSQNASLRPKVAATVMPRLTLRAAATAPVTRSTVSLPTVSSAIFLGKLLAASRMIWPSDFCCSMILSICAE